MYVGKNCWAAVVVAAGLIVGQAAPGAARAQEVVSYPARNDAIEMIVSGVRAADHYGPVKSAEGRKFVVLSTEWRNLLGATPVDGKLLSTPYLVPMLDQQLFLVVNGGRVAPLAAAAQGRPGTLATKNFTVPDPATSVRGNLVFDVPADARDLLLVFIDERYGAMSAQLAGTPVPAGPAQGNRAERNEILEAFVAGARVVDDGKASPDTQMVAVDLRVRSIFQPDRRTKAAKLVALPEWSGRYVQALVDGQYVGTPVAAPFDPAATTILPVVATGGEFVFRVPRKRTSLSVNLYFGEMTTATGKVRPRPLVLPVRLAPEGAPAAPKRSTVASTRDGVFDVSITGVTTAPEFGGAKAPEGKAFFVIDATVGNVSRQPEFFQSLEQLKHAGEQGEITGADDASLAGPHPPLAQLFIPPGERRSFQLVYAIPASETRPRIAYASVTEGGSKVLSLPKLNDPATGK